MLPIENLPTKDLEFTYHTMHRAVKKTNWDCRLLHKRSAIGKNKSLKDYTSHVVQS